MEKQKEENPSKEKQRLSDDNGKPFLMQKKENEEINKKEIKKLNNSLLPKELFSNEDKLYEFSAKLVKANLCPLKTPEDAMLALITGRELNISVMASLNGIYNINGKATLGVHVKKGILLNNNIIFKKIKECEPKYIFVKTNKEGKVFKGSDGKPVEVYRGFLDEQPDNTKKSKEPYDYETIYLFTRFFKIGNKYIKNNAYGKFSFSDAKKADLLEKDNWKNYLRDMLNTRAFSRGANEIADDLLGGMLSPTEMSDIEPNITVEIDENGIEQIVNQD